MTTSIRDAVCPVLGMFDKIDAFFAVRARQNLCQNQLSTSPLTLSTSPFRSLPLLHHDLFIHISLLITIFYILNLLLTIIHKKATGICLFDTSPLCIYKRFTNSFLLKARWNRYQSQVFKEGSPYLGNPLSA